MMTNQGSEGQPKSVEWMGSSRADLLDFPQEVRREIGFAVFQAQRRGKHPSAKPLKGFGGGSVLEVVADDDGSTFRAVYTVRFRLAVYVLHCFQKKSTKGIQTPKHVLDLVRQRLKQAEQHYKESYEQRDRSEATQG